MTHNSLVLLFDIVQLLLNNQSKLNTLECKTNSMKFTANSTENFRFEHYLDYRYSRSVEFNISKFTRYSENVIQIWDNSVHVLFNKSVKPEFNILRGFNIVQQELLDKITDDENLESTLFQLSMLHSEDIARGIILETYFRDIVNTNNTLGAGKISISGYFFDVPELDLRIFLNKLKKELLCDY